MFNSDDYQKSFFETLVPQALQCDFSFNVEYECFNDVENSHTGSDT